ncbi:MAG TPA: hypothetical protein VJU61_17330, partial [Polyangiaceae bacterium]|nr:hypothetical protein [Polyangiaceae bacterium]
SWSTLETTGLPAAREEAAFVALGGKGYLLGGRGNRSTGVFEPSTSTWTEGKAPPLPLHHFQPLALGNSIYALGVGALVEVTGTLLVQDNPELDASSLAGVQGRIKRSGNRDAVPTLLSPCPWADDDECDEPPDSDLCAPGTDPICALDY